ncbi:MAG: hypothetical protein Q4B52_00005 [Tissierellia bacterium]|nr:hypothetical protein [Tissierellia bacterium]
MKRILKIISIFAIAILITACAKPSAKSPESCVDEFLKSFKAGDLKTANEYLEYEIEGDAETFDDVDMGAEEINKFFKNYLLDYDYKVLKSEGTDEKKVVNAKIKNYDFNDLLSASITDLVSEALANPDIDEEEIAHKMIEKMEEATKKSKKVETNVVFNVEKIDDKWVITDSGSDLAEKIFGFDMDSLNSFDF